MRVIGTAGHVDHGKSTLVEALTGIHPDRLKEEREREMTIDLGFAWLTMPDGEQIGIIDVPGHRDFIENMLAGVGGIDAALFVIAADEGVMPQTREHLAILDILNVQRGVVTLTKIDLIDDPEWINLVEEDIRQVLRGTGLESAPLVRVSARTGEGLPEIVQSLQACLVDHPTRPDLGRPRLPVDRIFTIAGFGTVVTGTLLDGSFRVGDELVILPAGIKGRVRGLQNHKHKVDVAEPGGRTAVNISGVTVDQIKRGDVIALPGNYQPTRRLDVHFRLLRDASHSIKHNTEVKLFHGSAEVLARLRLLGTEELLPGEEGWLQLELSGDVVAVRGDRYILRRPSPGETLGGGVIIDPQPKGRHKRFSPEALSRLASLMQGEPSEVYYQALVALGVAPLKEVSAHSRLEGEVARKSIQDLLSQGQIVDLENRLDHQPNPFADSLVTSRMQWERLAGRALDEVESYHRALPLRQGMPREELKSRLKIPARTFNAVINRLVAHGALVETGPLVKTPTHAIRFNGSQQKLVDDLLARFASNLFTPPSIKECQVAVGEDVYNALVDLGILVPVSPEVVFSADGYDQMVTQVRELIQAHGSITAAQVRDHFNTSRKYVLALLEHLDGLGVTIREGDVRRMKR